MALCKILPEWIILKSVNTEFIIKVRNLNISRLKQQIQDYFHKRGPSSRLDSEVEEHSMRQSKSCPPLTKTAEAPLPGSAFMPYK